MMKEVSLGSLIEFQRGYDLTHSNMKGETYPVVGSTSVIGFHDDYKASDGIVIGRSGSVGKPQLIRGPYWPHNTVLFSTTLKGNDLNYMYYLIENLGLDRMKTGSNIPTLNRNDLYPLKIKAETDPSIQKELVKPLVLIDSQIANNNAIISKLESLAKAIYNYWFIQFDFPDENGKPYKSSGGKMVRNEELKREIPEGWAVSTYGKCISSINTGLNPRDNFKLNTGGKIKYLTVKNLTTNGTVDFSSCDTIDESARAIVHKRSDIKIGDVLFASISPLGRCFIITEDPVDWDINESVFSIRPNDANMTSSFLYMSFTSDLFVKRAEGSSVGSVFKGIRISELQGLEMVLPPKQILDSFNNVVMKLFEMKENAFKENRELESLRDFLLPMLMNGQVKIRKESNKID